MNNTNTLVVNFYAGPGASKSSMMASCFSKLKWKGINCEMAHEYAKEKVWEDSIAILNDQFYVSAKQYHKIKRLDSKVDVILTDSPLLLGIIYGHKEPKEFKDLLIKYYSTFTNLDIFLKRVKEYNPKGRLQSFEKAKLIDEKIIKLMESNCYEFYTFDGTDTNVNYIVDLIEDKLKLINNNNMLV